MAYTIQDKLRSRERRQPSSAPLGPSSTKVVYPHRRGLLSKKVCDVCGNEDVHFISIHPSKPYMGFRVCNTDTCNQMIKIWKNLVTISNNILQKEFGDWVYVRRSDGRKESSWIIKGDSYQEESMGPFWVVVRDEKRRRTKCVTLEQLREWNKSNVGIPQE